MLAQDFNFIWWQIIILFIKQYTFERQMYFMHHYSDVIWASYGKSLATQLFVQWLIQANSTYNKSSALLAHQEGIPPVTGGFPSQRANGVESVSIS